MKTSARSILLNASAAALAFVLLLSGCASDTAAKKPAKNVRYVWVNAPTGSHIGGRWVPENVATSTESAGSRSVSGESLRKSQDAGVHQPGG